MISKTVSQSIDQAIVHQFVPNSHNSSSTTTRSVETQKSHEDEKKLIASLLSDLGLDPLDTPRNESTGRGRRGPTAPPETERELEIWHNIYEKLLHTKPEPQPVAPFEKILDCSEDDLRELSGWPGSNAWYYPIRNGCWAEVLEKEMDLRTTRTLRLNGSKKAVQLTEKFINESLAARRAAVAEQPPWLPSKLNHGDTMLTRCVWVEGRREPPKSFILDEAFPPPRNWTIKSFMEYVEAVTEAGSLGLVNRASDLPGRLTELFLGTTKSAASTRALEIAVQFLVDEDRHLDALRLLNVLPAGLLSAEAFKYVLLSKSWAQSKGSNFLSCLSLMLRRGISPDFGTWTAFAAFTRNQKRRDKVVKQIKALGLLDTPTKTRRLVLAIIGNSFRTHQNEKGSARSFVSYLERNIGQDWASASILNTLLQMSILYGTSGDIQHVRTLYTSLSISPDTETLNALLIPHRRDGDLPGAITLLQQFDLHVHQGVSANARTMARLFDIAWGARSVSTCRVIWHYACMMGLSRQREFGNIREKLRIALLYPEIVVDIPVWMVIGVSPRATELINMLDRSEKGGQSPDEARRGMREVATKLIDAETQDGRKYRPLLPFVDACVAASKGEMFWQGGPTDISQLTILVPRVVKSKIR